MRRSAMALVAAGCAWFASSAMAQTYGTYGPPPGPAANEEVVIRGPHLTRPDHYWLNTPIGRASMSLAVSYSDLDLRSWGGRRELHSRIRRAAFDVCSALSNEYPVGLESNPTCFRNAVAVAEPQADAAIERARRGYAYEAR